MWGSETSYQESEGRFLYFMRSKSAESSFRSFSVVFKIIKINVAIKCGFKDALLIKWQETLIYHFEQFYLLFFSDFNNGIGYNDISNTDDQIIRAFDYAISVHFGTSIN